MASLRVITPGMLTTIQDLGRWGWQGRGVPVAGPMDPRSHRLANTLVGNEIDAATLVRSEELNTQLQTRITWPASSVVALAYVDQLVRTKGIQAERARSVKTALDRADDIRTGKERGAAGVIDQLDALATQLESDAGAAAGRDAARLHSLAATIKSRAAKLR